MGTFRPDGEGLEWCGMLRPWIDAIGTPRVPLPGPFGSAPTPRGGLDMSIEPFATSRHLGDLQRLVNWHLSAVFPGWSLPAAHIAAHLVRNPRQPVLDPWIAERRTLCAMEPRGVVAAAHLVRYRATEDVTDDYRGAGEISWALADPRRPAAGDALLREARRCLGEWRVRRAYAGVDLPVPLLCGVPDAWPHVAAMLGRAGFRAEQGGSAQETVRGGWLPRRDLPPAPLDGLRLGRRLGPGGATRLGAWHGGREVGACDLRTDLSEGGALPALAAWATIEDFEVEDAWRGRGVGTWLLTHAVAWMRLAGCTRVLLAVGVDDEGERAAHLYDRFGWGVLAREDRTWVADPPWDP